MKMERKTILTAIENREITALSIDTCIFDKYHFKLDHPVLQSLKQFKDGDFKLIISDIVLMEIKKHMVLYAKEIQKKWSEHGKQKIWLFSEIEHENIKKFVKNIEEKNIENLVEDELNKYIFLTGLQVAKAENNISVADLFKLYFDVSPPFFNKKSKKSEFPDAGILLTLESWAKKNNQKIIIVSEDAGWENYSDNSDYLIYIKDLTEALNLFQYQSMVMEFITNIKVEKSAEIIHLLRTEGNIDEKINFEIEEFSNLHFNETHQSCSYKIRDDIPLNLKPIEFKDNILLVEVSFTVELELDIRYELSKWDGIDREYVEMGSHSVHQELSTEVDAFITFNINGKNYTIENIEIMEETLHLDLEIEPNLVDICDME